MPLKDFISGIVGDISWLTWGLVVLIPIGGALLLHGIIFGILMKLARRASSPDLRIIAQELRAPALFFLLVIAIYIIVPVTRLDDVTDRWFSHIVALLIIASITWMLIRTLALARLIILNRYNIESKNNLKARKMYTQIRMIEKIIAVFILFVAVAAALMTFDKIREIGISLLASAGVVGIIVGFAAQKSLTNILAGIQIALTQPIRIDDVVIVEGEWGWIEEITLTYVVVKIWDKRRLIVPITYFIEKPFQNWTRVSSDIMGTVFIYADYFVDIDALRDELTNVLHSTSLWDGKVNVLQVTNCTEKSVELRALMSAESSGVAWDLRCLVREKLLQFLQQNHPESLPRTRVEMERMPEPQAQ